MYIGVKWIEVSPEYLKISKQLKILPTNWKEFFLGLGVQSGLAVERINREINPTKEVRQESLKRLVLIFVIYYRPVTIYGMYKAGRDHQMVAT